MDKNIVFIGLGANLGDAIKQVQSAIQALNAIENTHVTAVSSLYKTEPIDSFGDDYINAVAKLETSKQPLDLLRAIQHIENEFGRLRPYRNAPRTLDLDILLFNDISLNHKDLIIPHPRMTQRAFVLVPLAEIAPDIQIPNQQPLATLLQETKLQRIMRL